MFKALLLSCFVLLALAENPRVVIETTLGSLTLELDAEKAPITVQNFLQYVDEDFYDGTIFHRVIAGFMVQGGGFTSDMSRKQTRAPIKNEWQNGLKNNFGTIAMARLGGQADSATSQFFINVKDNSFLDSPNDGSAYAVFGKLVEGESVLKAIEAVQTGRQGGMSDVPKTPVVITKVTRAGTVPPPAPPPKDL